MTKGARARAYFADKLFVAGLGVVMAITFAFFVMAIPARFFEHLFAAAGAPGIARIGQSWVAAVSSAGAGLVVSLFFVPPRARRNKRLQSCRPDGNPDSNGPVGVTCEPALVPATSLIEEGVLDLLDVEHADSNDQNAEGPSLFIDLAVLRLARDGPDGSGVRLRPVSDMRNHRA